MSGMSQRLCWAGVLGFLAVGVGSFGVRQADELPRTLLPETEVGDVDQRARELSARHAAIQHRIAEKARIVDEVIADRLSLREAAWRFHQLHAAEPILFHPAVVTAFRKDHPDAPVEDEALLCLDIVRRVEEALHDRQTGESEAEAVRLRVRCEIEIVLSPCHRECQVVPAQ